jgi:thiol:disulfide interchange protein DsbC
VRVIGKGNKERLVPLGEEAVYWVENYLEHGRPWLLNGVSIDVLFPSQRAQQMTANILASHQALCATGGYRQRKTLAARFASCVCYPFTESRCRLTCGPDVAWPQRSLYDPDLYACRDGAAATASSATSPAGVIVVFKGYVMKKGFIMFTLLAAALTSTAHADDAAIKQSLAKLGVQSSDIQPAPVAGMKTVLTNSGVLYVTDDGKHIIQGPMYDVSGAQPVNVTNQLLTAHLNALEKEMIVYKAPQEKHVITVFTDITCGYCHKLHEEMADYNALGITVRYLAFPRQGLQSQAEQDMKAIWCAKDRNKALDDAMSGKGVKPASCDLDIADHYALGVQFGVNGTPAVVLNDGYLVPGYQGPKEMKAFLDEHQKQTGGK